MVLCLECFPRGSLLGRRDAHDPCNPSEQKNAVIVYIIEQNQLAVYCKLLTQYKNIYTLVNNQNSRESKPEKGKKEDAYVHTFWDHSPQFWNRIKEVMSEDDRPHQILTTPFIEGFVCA